MQDLGTSVLVIAVVLYLIAGSAYIIDGKWAIGGMYLCYAAANCFTIFVAIKQ